MAAAVHHMMAHEPYFFGYMFYKVDPKWRWLADMGKSESAKEVKHVLEQTGIKHKTYSTLGLRAESDFMVWVGSPAIQDIQKLASRLYSTVFGKYITASLNYICRTRPSIYSTEGRMPSFLTDEGSKEYAVVYPFTKTRQWYLLAEEQRRQMMAEHIAVSRRHPGITLNTAYSFGLDDHDFMLAFETDDLADFQDLIMELRATAVSAYVQSDTPMMVCVKKDIIPIIANLG